MFISCVCFAHLAKFRALMGNSQRGLFWLNYRVWANSICKHARCSDGSVCRVVPSFLNRHLPHAVSWSAHDLWTASGIFRVQLWPLFCMFNQAAELKTKRMYGRRLSDSSIIKRAWWLLILHFTFQMVCNLVDCVIWTLICFGDGYIPIGNYQTTHH